MKISIIAAIVLSVGANALSAVRLPVVFGDHMVLQRDARVPIWGTAAAGEEISVRFAGQEKQAAADASGKWMVHLDALTASATPSPLTVQGENTIDVNDVLVGDVWLCSGQSNMQMGLAKSHDGEDVVAKADHRVIRLFIVGNRIIAPEGDVSGAWAACSPATAARFSAVGYYFGRELHEQIGVPIGLINSSWGATGGESWTPIDAIRSSGTLRSIVEPSPQREEARAKARQVYEANLGAWKAQAAKAQAEGMAPPAPPKQPQSLRAENQPGACFDSMIRPLIPFALRGVIWYQGEGNLGNAPRYAELLPALITSWRQRWERDDLPFGIVQLPNNQPAVEVPADGDWPRLREVQFKTFCSVPHTGLAVTIDIGDALDGHPKNKRDVGLRLARWALADVYGKELEKSGPVFRSALVDGTTIKLTFDDAGGGLRIGRGEASLQGFAVSGDDRLWHWAKATIVGTNTIELSCDLVSAPKFARYAWANNPASANLTNDSGLPASPFRTDDWPKQ